MDRLENQASTLVKPNYIRQGIQGIRSRQNILSSLLSERKLPLNGWDDMMIEYTLNELAMMDSNNFPKNVGVGEREGRVYSSMVAKRHYHLSHGIGRSGDIAEVQPKAAGSSLMAKLTNVLATNAITQVCGFTSLKHGQVLPMATGMSLGLSMMALKADCNKDKPSARYVIWPRIDQKSCFKSIFVAGLTPIVIENELVPPAADSSCVGCQIQTDVAAIERAIETYGAENIVCVLSTTSCFAPRRPDKIDEIAKICARRGVGHVINNAYGLQCASIAKLVNRACTVGRVDYVVQSTDKNFLVPVGGAIVSSPTAVSIDNLTKCYAGRASLDPIMDLFITLLSMGQRGLKALLIERERLFVCLNTRLQSLCDTGNANGNGLALVHSPENPISIAISVEFLATLRQQQLEQIQANVQERVVTGSCSDEGTSDAAVDTLEEQMSALVTDKSSGTAVATTAKPAAASAPFDVNSIGAMLFYNCISGTRVIYAQSKPTMINGFSFVNWGSHANAFPVMPYITAAVAVGMTEEDVDRFIAEFDKVLKKCVKKVISR